LFSRHSREAGVITRGAVLFGVRTLRLSEDVEKEKKGSIDVAAACSEEGRRKSECNAENKRGGEKCPRRLMPCRM
jgi:hypothetical protein